MTAKLYVCNLHPDVTDAQFKEFITNAGIRVTTSGVVRDRLTGIPWGFGFVEIEEGEDLQQAMSGLNGQVLQGNTLTVNAGNGQGMGFAGSPGDSGQGGQRVGDMVLS